MSLYCSCMLFLSPYVFFHTHLGGMEAENVDNEKSAQATCLHTIILKKFILWFYLG